MSDPFARFGIAHLSCSSLNLWLDQPARWVARYLYDVRDESRPRPLRGSAVEAGLNQALAGENDEVALAVALDNFDRNVAAILSGDGNSEDLAASAKAERANIAPMLKLVSDNLRPLGRPLTTQRRVERYLPGIEIPIIGFCDYEFEEFVVDLKTTLRMPSTPTHDHCVQVVHYGDCLGKRPGLIYATPKKYQRFNSDQMDMDAARWTLRRAAIALRVHLEVAKSRDELAKMTVPKWDHFRWSDEKAKAVAKEIWS